MGRPKKQISFQELPDHFTAYTLQRFLGKNRQAIYTMLRSGDVPCRKIGKTYLIIKNEFGRAWGYIQPNTSMEK